MRQMPNFPGMPNFNQMPPYFMQMLEWYHMEMMRQYQGHGKDFPYNQSMTPKRGNRSYSQGQPNVQDSCTNCKQECNCPLKHGNMNMPPPPPPPSSLYWPYMSGQMYQDSQGYDRHYEKLSFVSPLQNSKKKWRDYDCHVNDPNVDGSAPRPFNLQSSNKKQNVDQLRTYNYNNKVHDQQGPAEGMDGKNVRMPSYQTSGNMRDNVKFHGANHNGKPQNLHVPTPAFSGVFKSPELNLSAK